MKIVIIVLLLSSAVINANSQCLRDSIFIIDSIGTYTDKLPMHLVVTVKNDSIIVSPIMVFKILSKIKCEWNNNITEGITSYKALPVRSGDEPQLPIINIVYKSSGKKYIEILYENKEARILSIGKVKN